LGFRRGEGYFGTYPLQLFAGKFELLGRIFNVFSGKFCLFGRSIGFLAPKFHLIGREFNKKTEELKEL
tara:strand:+ start:17727 stop:17930 length:204 start_codon:yes stop_codon:yes gene_type:complete